MLEPTKDALREKIEKLQEALYVAQNGREQAEKRLKAIEDALSAPEQEEPGPKSRIYWGAIDRALSAAERKQSA